MNMLIKDAKSESEFGAHDCQLSLMIYHNAPASDAKSELSAASALSGGG